MRMGTRRFASAVAIPIAIARVVSRNFSLQACFQRRGSAILERLGQVPAHIRGGQLAALAGLVVAGEILRVGQQLLDLSIAKHPTRGNRAAARNGAFEGAHVQGTDGLHGVTITGRAQRKLRGQALGISQPGAAVAWGMSILFGGPWRHSGMGRGGNGMQGLLTGRSSGKGHASPHDGNPGQERYQELAFEYVQKSHTNSSSEDTTVLPASVWRAKMAAPRTQARSMPGSSSSEGKVALAQEKLRPLWTC